MSDSEILFQYWKIACLSMTETISNSWEHQIESIRAMSLSAPSSVISCAMGLSTALSMTYSAVAENISRGGVRTVASNIQRIVHSLSISSESFPFSVDECNLDSVSDILELFTTSIPSTSFVSSTSANHTDFLYALTGICFAFPVFRRDLPLQHSHYTYLEVQQTVTGMHFNRSHTIAGIPANQQKVTGIHISKHISNKLPIRKIWQYGLLSQKSK